jgi:hypothetical protein
LKRILTYRASDVAVKQGDPVTTYRGESATVEGWIEPHKSDSTGRVVLRIGTAEPHAYFPSVIDAEWREEKSNRIVEVKLTVDDVGDWLVEVKKEFAAEHGGGSQTFAEFAGSNLHRALDVARSMVTLTPGQRNEVTNG